MVEELKVPTSAFRLSDEEDEDGEGASTERLSEEELDDETKEESDEM
jgi:hypothetical protein